MRGRASSSAASGQDSDVTIVVRVKPVSCPSLFHTVCEDFRTSSGCQVLAHEVNETCFEETIYSCCHASKWRHALTLLTEMRSLELEPDVACESTVIEGCILEDSGFSDAIAWYRMYRQQDVRNVEVATCGGEGLDLHYLTGELARLAVRVKLLDLAVAMTSTEFWSNPRQYGLQADGSLFLIVGAGQHSKGETVLGPSLLQMLNQELGLQAHYHPRNAGVLRIPKQELLQLIYFAWTPADEKAKGA